MELFSIADVPTFDLTILDSYETNHLRAISFDMTKTDDDGEWMDLSSVAKYALFDCESGLLPDVMCTEQEKRWSVDVEDMCDADLCDVDYRDQVTLQCARIDPECMDSMSLSKVIATSSNQVCAECACESEENSIRSFEADDDEACESEGNSIRSFEPDDVTTIHIRPVCEETLIILDSGADFSCLPMEYASCGTKVISNKRFNVIDAQ